MELDKEEDEGEKSNVEIVEGIECVEMGEGPGIRWVSVECSADDGVVVEEGREVWKKGVEDDDGDGDEDKEGEEDVCERLL